MEDIKKNEVKKLNTKRLRMEITLGLILLLFLAYKFSIARYLGFITITDAKQIIEDFERHYLYTQSLNTEAYLDTKKETLSGTYTTKEKLELLINKATEAAKDDTTVFSYADVMKGKLNYSIFEKLKFESKVIDGNIAYVRLNTLGQNSSKKFIKAVKKMRNKEYLVIDLRDNSIGDYAEAVGVADYLLPENAEICTIQYAYSRHQFNSDQYCMKYKKIFVLLNEGSGYCSEIIALTLKSNLGEGVELIGTRTAQKNIGEFYNSYYNKIDLSTAALSWEVKGSKADALAAHLGKYSSAQLEELDDYLSIVNTEIK